MVKKAYGLTMFSLGAFIGWCTAIALSFWAGKNLDKFLAKEEAKAMRLKKPIRATID